MARRPAPRRSAVLAKQIRFANAVRKLFMGDGAEGLDNQIEVTFSTRTLIRWALLTLLFAAQKGDGVDAVSYALDRALGFRASPPSRFTLKELQQRIFG